MEAKANALIEEERARQALAVVADADPLKELARIRERHTHYLVSHSSSGRWGRPTRAGGPQTRLAGPDNAVGNIFAHVKGSEVIMLFAPALPASPHTPVRGG